MMVMLCIFEYLGKLALNRGNNYVIAIVLLSPSNVVVSVCSQSGGSVQIKNRDSMYWKKVTTYYS